MAVREAWLNGTRDESRTRVALRDGLLPDLLSAEVRAKRMENTMEAT
jgi:hypothetical protein